MSEKVRHLVYITRKHTTQESTGVIVRAETGEEAKALALEVLKDNPQSARWVNTTVTSPNNYTAPVTRGYTVTPQLIHDHQRGR